MFQIRRISNPTTGGGHQVRRRMPDLMEAEPGAGRSIGVLRGVAGCVRSLGIVCGCILIGACATKQFEEMRPLDAPALRSMSCADLEQEFVLLQRHERGVDQEATSGQVKQIVWGGIWSVMADEKLEHVARQKIRDRERQLYEAKLKKKCP